VCPHAGTPLDWKPHQFLAPDGRTIQCATHGARFEITTGTCIFGPCKGRALDRIRVYTKDDKIFLETTT
jgi:nitrite reductase/ring-hydroxylating ferredoxin subunit